MWNGSPTPLSPGPLLPLLSIFPPQANPTDEAVGLSPSPTCSVVAVQPASNANTDACRVASVHAEANERQISSPCQKTRSNAKRKVKDREPPTERRSLTDMYSKRSSSLLRKGEELAHFTHAYVLVFAARPETIGEGNQRLFVSDEFKNADPDLIARINKVTQELNDIALELAHRAGWEVQGRKKRRTDDSNRPAKSQEQARPSHSTSASCSTSRGPATQNQTPNQLPKHIMTSNAGRLNSTLVPPKENAAITLPPTSKPFGMEQSKITNVVRALIKLPPNQENLDLLREFAQSEVGVRAIDNAGAIPVLIALLNRDDLPLACGSALILTSMMGNWMACAAILRAGAAVPLIRLLSRDIGSETLQSIAHACGRCIPPCPEHFEHRFEYQIPSDALGQLSALLGPGQMEVRLAAAQVIRGLHSAEYWRFIRDNGAFTNGIALDLCRLVLDCRDLSEKDSVLSVINAIQTKDTEIQESINSQIQTKDTEIQEFINSQILPSLIHFLDDTNTETVVAACRVLRKPMVFKDTQENYVILRHLTPLLSHPDDEVFAEAVWTSSVLTPPDWCNSRLPSSFPSTVIRRLSQLLHHHKEHVVISALHAIADAPCLPNVLVDFFLDMSDEGDVHRVINLFESNNQDVAEAALLVIRRIQDLHFENPYSMSVPSVLRYFLKHGVIPVLVRNLSCPSNFFQQTTYAISSFRFFMECPLLAPTILQLVQLLSSLENVAKVVVISVINDLVSEDTDSTCLDPDIPPLLLQVARDGIDSPDVLPKVLWLICRAIRRYSALHDAFWAAGAESFLTDPQLRSRITGLYEDDDGMVLQRQVEDSLVLLREDPVAHG